MARESRWSPKGHTVAALDRIHPRGKKWSVRTGKPRHMPVHRVHIVVHSTMNLQDNQVRPHILPEHSTRPESTKLFLGEARNSLGLCPGYQDDT